MKLEGKVFVTWGQEQKEIFQGLCLFIFLQTFVSCQKPNIYFESTKFPWNIHEFEFYAFPSFMSSLFVFFSSIISNVSNFVSECFCICAVFCLNISVFTFARTGGQLGPPHKCQILLALWKGAHHQIINLFKEIKVVIACLCWDLICYLRVVGGLG